MQQEIQRRESFPGLMTSPPIAAPGPAHPHRKKCLDRLRLLHPSRRHHRGRLDRRRAISSDGKRSTLYHCGRQSGADYPPNRCPRHSHLCLRNRLQKAKSSSSASCFGTRWPGSPSSSCTKVHPGRARMLFTQAPRARLSLARAGADSYSGNNSRVRPQNSLNSRIHF